MSRELRERHYLSLDFIFDFSPSSIFILTFHLPHSPYLSIIHPLKSTTKSFLYSGLNQHSLQGQSQCFEKTLREEIISVFLFPFHNMWRFCVYVCVSVCAHVYIYICLVFIEYNITSSDSGYFANYIELRPK